MHGWGVKLLMDVFIWQVVRRENRYIWIAHVLPPPLEHIIKIFRK